MPSDRDRLKVSLAQPTTPPTIQRGRGVTLSTATPVDGGEELKRQNAKTPHGFKAEKPNGETAHEPERTSRGFAIRTDLVKAMKRVAIDDDKKLYEVLEAAIEQYLDRRQGRG